MPSAAPTIRPVRIDGTTSYLRQFGTAVAKRDSATAVNLRWMIADALDELALEKRVMADADAHDFDDEFAQDQALLEAARVEIEEILS